MKEMELNKYSQSITSIVLYIRLSLEDVGVRNGYKEESNSITNQRMLLYDYVRRNEKLKNAKIIEKCDDGYSGNNFERPAFLEMIDLAKRREIDCIIVKDFSRFGRDYIEVGNYLEQIFPFLGIRFISVNDHYDSALYPKQTLGLEMVFKNFVYDTYCRESSKKARCAWERMAKDGSYRGTKALYGYQKSKNDKHKLVIDPETAPIVKEIFELRLSGCNASDISRKLNSRGVPSPAKYAREHHETTGWKVINEETVWLNCTVMRILRNEKYTGTMVSLRTQRVGINGKSVLRDQQEWIKVPNTHEAIISMEKFQEVQRLLPDYKKPKAGKRKNVFRCGYCGRKMARSRTGVNYLCVYGDANPTAQCHGFRVDAGTLENVVLQELKNHIQRFVSFSSCEKSSQTDLELNVSNQILCEKKMEFLESEKTNLYEKYKDSLISRDEYLDKKRKCDLEMKEYQDLLKNERANEERNKNNEERKNVDELVQKYKNIDKLTSEIQDAFIERIDVYSPDRIKITWKFARVFEE